MIRTVAEKLVEQVAIGAMQLDAIEAGRFGVHRAEAVLLDDAWQLGECQRPRCFELLSSVDGVRLAHCRDGRRADW